MLVGLRERLAEAGLTEEVRHGAHFEEFLPSGGFILRIEFHPHGILDRLVGVPLLLVQLLLGFQRPRLPRSESHDALLALGQPRLDMLRVHLQLVQLLGELPGLPLRLCSRLLFFEVLGDQSRATDDHTGEFRRERMMLGLRLQELALPLSRDLSLPLQLRPCFAQVFLQLF
jgi:hypothetical protein